MTASDIAAWNEFASTVADVAAALAGLLFVGLSMNLREVLAYPALLPRAAATLGLLIATLLTGIFLVTPGQDRRVFAVEVGAVGLVMAIGAASAALRQRSGQRSSRSLYSLVSLGIPAVLLIVGGVSVWIVKRRRPVLDHRRGGGRFRVHGGECVGAFGGDQALTTGRAQRHAQRGDKLAISCSCASGAIGAADGRRTSPSEILLRTLYKQCELLISEV